MKICFIVGLYPFNKGGAEYQAKILSDNFTKHHEVFFIMSLPNIKEKDFYFDGVRIFNIQFSPLSDKMTLYYMIFKQINLIIEAEKPDIIYHRVIMPYTWHIVKIAKRKSIPLILHIASNHSISFNKSLSSKVKKSLLKAIIKLGPKLLVQTPEQKLLLSKITSKKISILPNLIYHTEITPSIKKTKNIVWIGKSAPIKQLNVFLDVAETMLEENSELNFVVIARFFKDTYSENLLKRADKLSNVVIIGEKDNIFINEYLNRNAYLLVNTSVSEGFSNTFLQAWSNGVPVISLNSNPENIFDQKGIGGFCNNDSEQIRLLILEYTSNEELYKVVSNNCINIIKDNYSIEKLFPKYKLLFEEFKK